MPKATGHIVLDTSCIVALVSGWHERHAIVTRTVSRCLDDGMELAIAAHSLVEAYSVLTRLPAPHRLAPRDARALLENNFEDRASVRALRATEYWQVVRSAADDGVAGGRTYDALIAKAAGKLAPCTLLTLNAKHFGLWDREGVTIREP